MAMYIIIVIIIRCTAYRMRDGPVRFNVSYIITIHSKKKKIVRAKILSIRKKRKNIFTSGLTVESPYAYYAEKS